MKLEVKERPDVGVFVKVEIVFANFVPRISLLLKYLFYPKYLGSERVCCQQRGRHGQGDDDGQQEQVIQPVPLPFRNKPIQDGGDADAPLWLNRLSGTN